MWERLIGSEEFDAPWIGQRRVGRGNRVWDLAKSPNEIGWYRFRGHGGRYASVVGPAECDPNYFDQFITGYLVGNRLIPDGVPIVNDPHKLADQTELCHLTERGLPNFSRCRAGIARFPTAYFFVNLLYPFGPEDDVERAYVDRASSTAKIKGVTPALEFAFRWMSYQREQMERLAAEAERRRIEEEQRIAEEARREQALKDIGTGTGRRAMAVVDFPTAARAALAMSGAEYLDARTAYDPNHMIVHYRMRRQRLDCMVDRRTLAVVDAGICLEDHRTRIRGDTLFTLESLPVVVAEAMDTGRLVVWRHLR